MFRDITCRLTAALGLLIVACSLCAHAGVMSKTTMLSHFPAPLIVGEKESELPVWPIFKQDATATPLVGYVFESIDLATGGPDNNSGGNTNHVGQALISHPLAKRIVDAVASIGQHTVPGRSSAEQVAHLLQENLWLARKRNVFGNPRLPPANGVFGPDVGQVQLPGYRQATFVTGQRNIDGHLAVVLFTQYAAVLAGHAHRMVAFLGKTGVINDPPAASAEIHLWHNPLRHAIEQLLVASLRLGDKVMLPLARKSVEPTSMQALPPLRIVDIAFTPRNCSGFRALTRITSMPRSSRISKTGTQ